MSEGDSPERPIFVANSGPPAGARPAKGSAVGCLGLGCGGGAAMIMVAVGVAAITIASAVRQCSTQVGSTVNQIVTGLVVPNMNFNFDFDGLARMWGVDVAAENIRRLEYVAQSLEEYEKIHGRPPAALTELTLLAGDREDVWGVQLEYRVVGSPPKWQIRSAGRDRQFDPNDPWLPAR